MFTRTIANRFVPRVFYHTLSINNTKTILNSKHLFFSHPTSSIVYFNDAYLDHSSNTITQLRLYTTPPSNNLDNMIVDFEQVKKATNEKDVLIVDVREPDEIKEHGKIPNSVNIPLGTVSSVLGTMSEKEFEQAYKRPKPTEDSQIIFYCMIGKRSGMAQQNAFNLGYKNVKNYLGSWTDWASKGQN